MFTGKTCFTLETSTQPAGVETLPLTTGALQSTVTCCLSPAPLASPTYIVSSEVTCYPASPPTSCSTAPRTSSSSPVQSGFTVLACRPACYPCLAPPGSAGNITRLTSLIPLAMTSMGPRLPATVSIPTAVHLPACCLLCHH